MTQDAGVEFLEVGVEDYAYGRDFIVHEAEGDTEGGEVVDEVCGAVDLENC